MYHGLHRHQQYGAGFNHDLHPEPWDERGAPWVRDEGELDLELRDIYRLNAPIILRRQQLGGTLSLFNYPINNHITVEQLMTHANDVYDSQENAFRLNVSFGIILRNVETGQYRYFRAFFNESLFTRPLVISRRSNLRALQLKLRRMNITDYLLRQRPNTKWKPHLLTNARFAVTSTNFPLGVLQEPLPAHIRSSKSIVSLTHTINGRPYLDNMCAFRCLAVYRKRCNVRQERQMNRVIGKYLREWMDYLATKRIKTRDDKDCTALSFKGVELVNIPHFEACFSINVNIYELSETRVAKPTFKSRCRFADTMILNMYNNHLSLVKKPEAYCRKYQCNTCSRLFDRLCHYLRHVRICTGKTKTIFPGGHFKPPQTVFDLLEEYGISVPNENRYYPYFGVYDFEAILTKVEERSTEKSVYTQRHDVISVSINSNIPGHNVDKCIINPDLETLLTEMMERVNDMQETSSTLAKEKWADVIAQLSKSIERWEPTVAGQSDDDEDAAMETDENEPASEEFTRAMSKANVYRSFLEKLTNENRFEINYNDWEETGSERGENDDDDGGQSSETDADVPESNHVRKTMHKQLSDLRDKFVRYCEELPILGFNSRTYDLNLIKGKIAKHLEMHKGKHTFTVKVDNAYNCLSNGRLKFLDITQYL
jgi:hypothetical protein